MNDPPIHGGSQHLGNCGSLDLAARPSSLHESNQLDVQNMLLPSSTSNRVELMTVVNEHNAEHLMF
jgi:hypothetical protein